MKNNQGNTKNKDRGVGEHSSMKVSHSCKMITYSSRSFQFGAKTECHWQF